MRSGFTIIELCVGAIIIGLFLAIAVPKFLHLCIPPKTDMVCGDIVYPHTRLVTGNGGIYIKNDQTGEVMALPPGRFCHEAPSK